MSIDLSHPYLPAEIKVSFEPFSVKKNTPDSSYTENMSGAVLVRKMAKHFLGEQDIDIRTKKYEKPRAFLNKKEISISFSHTFDALSAAMSQHYVVGCDLESVYRTVNPRIVQRMKEPDENETLYKENESIRLWTIKESALKMIGTGLRKPMNSILVEQTEPDFFTVDFNDGRQGKICSFQYHEHWITICFEKTNHLQNVNG